jgi:4-amino-4-deoxy-L-arabinose transferase-like glycosyltransferase
VGHNGEVAGFLDRIRFPWPVWVLSGAVVVLLLALASRYGLHRDEMYFVAAGRHLDWGFVDQPPLTPLLARLVDVLPGDPTAFRLRVIPAFAVGGVVLLTAHMARALGGGRFAMSLAALAVVVSGLFLALGHLLATASIEALIWVAICAVLLGLIQGADQRWWLVVGFLAGLGVLNKFTIATLLLATLIGLLLTPARHILASGWVLAAGLIAGVLAAPTLVWQASNGWPQFEMAAILRERSDGPLTFVVLQLVSLSLVLIVPAVAGFLTLWSRVGGRYRVFPISFAIVFLVFLVTGGKFYYLGAYYPVLLAAGSVVLATVRWRWALPAAMSVFGVVAAIIALPVVPPDQVAEINKINNELGETIGWPALVEQVRTVTEELQEDGVPAKSMVIVASNYGEAAALQLDADPALPVVSGHNAYWFWGPIPDRPVVISVGNQATEQLQSICTDLHIAAKIDNPEHIDNQELGQPIAVCEHLTQPLPQAWTNFRHLD